jgi:hypothetical protein
MPRIYSAKTDQIILFAYVFQFLLVSLTLRFA